jgi:hypothetical protein
LRPTRRRRLWGRDLGILGMAAWQTEHRIRTYYTRKPLAGKGEARELQDAHNRGHHRCSAVPYPGPAVVDRLASDHHHKSSDRTDGWLGKSWSSRCMHVQCSTRCMVSIARPDVSISSSIARCVIQLNLLPSLVLFSSSGFLAFPSHMCCHPHQSMPQCLQTETCLVPQRVVRRTPTAAGGVDLGLYGSVASGSIGVGLTTASSVEQLDRFLAWVRSGATGAASKPTTSQRHCIPDSRSEAPTTLVFAQYRL